MHSFLDKYEVHLIEADSDHPLAKYVEDDEQTFVIKYNGADIQSFWPADEFFNMESIGVFYVEK